MENIGEKIAYLKGLAEGLKVDESTNEGKIIKAGGRAAHGHVLVKIGLTAKHELRALSLRQGQHLGNMLEILGLIPTRGAGNGAIPIVIGNADAGKPQLGRSLQNVILRLHRIGSTGRGKGMQMIIVVDLVSHIFSPYFMIASIAAMQAAR